jgi:hypothetical protein
MLSPLNGSVYDQGNVLECASYGIGGSSVYINHEV